MNTKTKSIFVLIGVLLIGIIIGAMGSTVIRRQMWEDRISRYKTPDGFINHLLETIQPDPDQKEAVEKILIKHHQKMMEIGEQSRKMIKNHADSLIIDLKPVLTAEQLEKLEHFFKRIRTKHRQPHGAMRPPRGEAGPPPGEPGPPPPED